MFFATAFLFADVSCNSGVFCCGSPVFFATFLATVLAGAFCNGWLVAVVLAVVRVVAVVVSKI